MSKIDRIAGLVSDTAVSITWGQWGTVGATGSRSTASREQSIIDPEALVLASISFRNSERRLGDFLAWWAEVGSKLISIQRLKTMRSRFQLSLDSDLEGFAFLALEAGDRRWSRFAGGTFPHWAERPRKGTDAPDLSDAATLMLRLRAGFGVNAKADALAYLIGREGAQVTVQEITTATGYSKVAIGNALRDMVMARFVAATSAHPTRYFVDINSWAHLLYPGQSSNLETGSSSLPRWTHWSDVLAFLARSRVLLSEAIESDFTEYVISSKLRDLTVEFRDGLTKRGIRVSEYLAYRGTEFLSGFKSLVEDLQETIRTAPL